MRPAVSLFEQPFKTRYIGRGWLSASALPVCCLRCRVRRSTRPGRDGLRRSRAQRNRTRLHAAARRARPARGARRQHVLPVPAARRDRTPLDPEIPLIFGSGPLTGLVPSAARGNCTSWSPDSGVLMDCNAGDYFPSFIRMNGIDHLVFYGRAPAWTTAGHPRRRVRVPRRGALRRPRQHRHARRRSARPRRRVGAQHVDGEHHACRRESGPDERHHGGAEGDLRPRRPRCEDGRAAAQGHRDARRNPRISDRASPTSRTTATSPQKLLGTSVVKNALSKVGTPFLYKPSRLLGAMGTKNNQETTWTDKLDAGHIDPYRPGHGGLLPLSGELPAAERSAHAIRRDRYGKGDGPEYVTLGKFGPNLGIESVEAVIRLNNICNDLGFDTASMGSALGMGLRTLPTRHHHDRRTPEASSSIGATRR